MTTVTFQLKKVIDSFLSFISVVGECLWAYNLSSDSGHWVLGVNKVKGICLIHQLASCH